MPLEVPEYVSRLMLMQYCSPILLEAMIDRRANEELDWCVCELVTITIVVHHHDEERSQGYAEQC